MVYHDNHNIQYIVSSLLKYNWIYKNPANGASTKQLTITTWTSSYTVFVYSERFCSIPKHTWVLW